VTATASDEEMARRIDAHRRERPAHWRVREEPVSLARAVQQESGTGDLLLVDCLTLGTANCLWPPAPAGPSSAAPGEPPHFQPDLPGWLAQRDAFIETLRRASSEIIVVSNEVGTSLVPENAAARLFRDEQGRLNQLVAAACDSVFLVSAGLSLRLK
jgi:adenosylcobinamide kinase/adenosylcobinamide-phosphate guanylyltransferase